MNGLTLRISTNRNKIEMGPRTKLEPVVIPEDLFMKLCKYIVL